MGWHAGTPWLYCRTRRTRHLCVRERGQRAAQLPSHFGFTIGMGHRQQNQPISLLTCPRDTSSTTGLSQNTHRGSSDSGRSSVVCVADARADSGPTDCERPSEGWSHPVGSSGSLAKERALASMGSGDVRFMASSRRSCRLVRMTWSRMRLLPLLCIVCDEMTRTE